LNEDYFDFDLYNIPEDGNVIQQEEILAENVVVLYKEDYQLQQALLEKIFQAVGIDLTKRLSIVQLDKGQQINLSKILTPKTKQVVSFGIAQSKLGINATFKAYLRYKTDTFSILLSHSLKKLAESKEHKKALWEALKKIYAQ